MIDLTGVGAVLGGVGTLIIAAAALRAGKTIKAIDTAVNGKPKGAQTIQSQVDDLHSDRPKPPEVTPEINGDALLPLVRLLVADMNERRNS